MPFAVTGLLMVCWLSITVPGSAADALQVDRVTIGLIREAEIPARDSGVLTEVNIVEGEVVTRGHVAAVLENSVQLLDLRAAELNRMIADLQADSDLTLRMAHTQRDEAIASHRATEIAFQIANEAASSKARVDVATADTQLRKLELERALGARTSFKGSISETELDRLRTAVRKGELEVEQAQHDLAVLQLRPDAERAALTQKEKEIERSEVLIQQEERNARIAGLNRDLASNAIDQARARLDRRSVIIPFDGVIARVDVHVGEWVEPGTPVARMIDLSVLKAEGFLPADQASPKLVGNSVTIQLKSTGQSLPGRVTWVSAEVDPVLQQVRFRAEFENPDQSVRPGTTASLRIAD